MDNEYKNLSNPRKATQADPNWNPLGNTPQRKATQADPNWNPLGNTPQRKATQADLNWNPLGNTPQRKATQADPNWNPLGNTPQRKATQADLNWNPLDSAAQRKATRVDDSWNGGGEAGNALDGISANPYTDIRSFQEAAARLPELVSATGRHYPVKRTLSKDGGQSAILLCSDADGRDVVAKVFFGPVDGSASSVAARARVLEYMRSEAGRQYTLAVTDNGQAVLDGGRYYFEIMPYCREGDLSHEPPLPFEAIVKLAKYLNEALHSMHTAGILHRDIKPENIYKLDKHIVIGDFGIARLANAVGTGYSPGTDGYRAPESLMVVSSEEAVFFFDEKCDYYSLGVTLGTLFEGHFVFENMDAHMRSIALRNGRLPLTRQDPHRAELENLLNGLCKFDSRYRFGYEDVNRWLMDHNYIGSAMDGDWPKVLEMLNETYSDEKSLFMGITKDAAHWKEGKEMLFGRYFEDFFRSFRTGPARAAQNVDAAYHGKEEDKGLFIFLKSLYAPGPIVWKGYTFGSLMALADKMAATRTPAAYGEILQNRVVSYWLEHTTGIRVDEGTLNLVKQIEDYADAEPEIACYWFGNCFAAKKRLSICGREVSDIPGLIQSLFSSPRDFYLIDGMKKLMDRHEGADLYGFLYSFGCRELSDTAWEQAVYCDQIGRGAVLFSMLDMIAAKASGNVSLLRSFFKIYGPLGIASYTQQLVTRHGEAVYMPLDADGRQMIARIADFRPGHAATVEEIFRAYDPLVKSVDKMQTILEQNPYSILSGTYSGKSILCANLTGCFAFELWGKKAPLGFSAWIENSKGGAVR